ncbi:hypothetical protein GIB67_024214 [Kingdonia uniflora]|uniref:Uncharacterized protein n=1 Tax=Kingdonia uniflora TaxID=39325 RepID=A0A7J7LZK4_9MAGN|nr:hypothetical protein GIB67_024214 [Kingdonia uniflora]
MRNHIEAPTIGVAHAINPHVVDALTVITHVVSAPVIGRSSSATEIRAVVVKVCSQPREYVRDNTLLLGDTLLLGQYQFLTPKKTSKRKQKDEENLLQQVAPGEGLEVVKDLMADDVIEVGMEVNLEVISSEYGSGLLEWKKGGKKDDEDEKNDDDEKDVEEKVKSVEEDQPQVAKKEEVQEKNGDEKVDDVEKDDEEKAKFEEEQPQLAEEEDSEQQTVVVYYNGKKDVQHANETMVVTDVAKTDIVFFNQEEVIGEAYQTKESKEEVE